MRVMINKRTVNRVVIKRKDRYMKKSLIAVAVVMIVGTSGLAIAQMQDKGKEMMGDKAGMMDGKGGMMGKGMMGMHGMMMKMMEKSVVATSDGGIVVVSATKLSKYDKDLNLVKEVDLKNDMEDMQKMMSDMMEKCPMMKGMMGGMDKQSDKAQDTTPAASGEVDHASHH